jgi:hypothetical protein
VRSHAAGGLRKNRPCPPARAVFSHKKVAFPEKWEYNETKYTLNTGGIVMHVVPGFVVREIAGETIAIPAGAAARELSGLLALNGSGQFLFELLQTEQTEDSLVNAMLETYEIDEATARADVVEFVEILRNSGVLAE